MIHIFRKNIHRTYKAQVYTNQVKILLINYTGVKLLGRVIINHLYQVPYCKIQSKAIQFNSDSNKRRER